MFTKYGDGQIISVFDVDEFLEKDSKKQKSRIKKGIDFDDNDTLDEFFISEDENQGEDE